MNSFLPKQQNYRKKCVEIDFRNGKCVYSNILKQSLDFGELIEQHISHNT